MLKSSKLKSRVGSAARKKALTRRRSLVIAISSPSYQEFEKSLITLSKINRDRSSFVQRKKMLSLRKELDISKRMKIKRITTVEANVPETGNPKQIPTIPSSTFQEMSKLLDFVDRRRRPVSRLDGLEFSIEWSKELRKRRSQSKLFFKKQKLTNPNKLK